MKGSSVRLREAPWWETGRREGGEGAGGGGCPPGAPFLPRGTSAALGAFGFFLEGRLKLSLVGRCARFLDADWDVAALQGINQKGDS